MIERLYVVAAVPFEAARQIGTLPADHRARRLHGHSFLVRVGACLPADWALFPGMETEQLVKYLAACVQPLDYSLLNEHLAVPTDENLARWVRTRLDVPGVEQVCIQSTRHQGADLADNERIHLWRRFRFEAAHQLPNVPEGHKCGRLHGHSFEVVLHAKQNLNGQDTGVDFDRLEALWAPLHAELHYTCLNDLPGLENSTSEHLARWIWQRLKPMLLSLSRVTVYETVTAGCHYDGQYYRLWKDQRFESALYLHRAPASDPHRRLHGHSYLIRLHLTAPLDDIMGWTVDYGDVKELFKPVYQQLDHHRLDQLENLADADLSSLLQWIRMAITVPLPQLDRIDLYQTPGCGAILYWGKGKPALPV